METGDQIVDLLLDIYTQSKNGFNVSGMTDNGTGDYVIAINNDMANTNYCVLSSGGHGDAGSTIQNLEGFNSNQVLPTLNLVSSESDESDLATQFEEVNTSVLTSKIESVQKLLNNARVQAGSQYMALEHALVSATDLRTQYQMGYDMVHDLDFSNETAELTRKQILQEAAKALMAQANNGQHGLLKMLTR